MILKLCPRCEGPTDRMGKCWYCVVVNAERPKREPVKFEPPHVPSNPLKPFREASDDK